MKIVNLILAVLFLLFAVVQLNDPDWEFWTALYLSVALIYGFAAFGRSNRWIILLVMAACVYELSTLITPFLQWIKDGMPSIAESMKASTPYVELVREFLGAAIAFVALIFQYTRVRYQVLRSTGGHADN